VPRRHGLPRQCYKVSAHPVAAHEADDAVRAAVIKATNTEKLASVNLRLSSGARSSLQTTPCLPSYGPDSNTLAMECQLRRGYRHGHHEAHTVDGDRLRARPRRCVHPLLGTGYCPSDIPASAVNVAKLLQSRGSSDLSVLQLTLGSGVLVSIRAGLLE